MRSLCAVPPLSVDFKLLRISQSSFGRYENSPRYQVFSRAANTMVIANPLIPSRGQTCSSHLGQSSTPPVVFTSGSSKAPTGSMDVKASKKLQSERGESEGNPI